MIHPLPAIFCEAAQQRATSKAAASDLVAFDFNIFVFGLRFQISNKAYSCVEVVWVFSQ